MSPLTTLYISIILAINAVIAYDHHKRVSSGFTVREKNIIPNSAVDSYVTGTRTGSEDTKILLKPLDYSMAISDRDNRAVKKRAPSGFMEMRGKKPFSVQQWEGTYPDAFKRTPSGFMGMRGKKDNEFVGYGVKRIPSGFMGMRGKKEISYPNLRTNQYSDKRTPMGFLGVRGKKGYNSLLTNDKRTSFGFLMRGKKHSSGFFGMRGKKHPYKFRGKFVGVRGKKMSHVKCQANSDYYDLDLERLGEKLNIDQILILLTEQNEANIILRSNNCSDLSRQ